MDTQFNAMKASYALEEEGRRNRQRKGAAKLEKDEIPEDVEEIDKTQFETLTKKHRANAKLLVMEKRVVGVLLFARIFPSSWSSVISSHWSSFLVYP